MAEKDQLVLYKRLQSANERAEGHADDARGGGEGGEGGDGGGEEVGLQGGGL